ncbi:MAG: CIA30 family protein [Pseudomonadales bacterium]|jgi:hypothetical protein|nr:CIA30 family protein [Pseudomonadales bacterium]
MIVRALLPTLLLLAVAAEGAQHDAMLLTDFTDAVDPGWYVVNDDVMGGRSSGDFRIEDGVLHFAGRTNTNGGGFSSIRSRPALPSLAGRGAIVLRARGDGRRYVFRLESDDGVAYWADFEPPAGEWSTVHVPFADFRPRFRGRWLASPALDPARIVALGLMCYDGRDGPFRLEVQRISAE